MNRPWLLWVLLCVPVVLSSCRVSDFSIATSAPSVSVTRGSSGTVQVSIAPQDGFDVPVTLSASGLPNGVTASFKPASISLGVTSALTISASASADLVTGKSATITAQGDGKTHTAPLGVTVTAGTAPPPPPGAPTITTFSATPSSLTAAGNVTLEWDVTGATSLEIDGGVGAVTPLTTGSKSLSVNATTTFTLTAKAGSATTTKSVDVTVGSVSLVPGVWDSTNWNESVWQ
jgi:hypothetical protein